VLNAGLEAQPTTIPATAEARAKRLAELKVEITEIYSRYKRHAERTLRYAIDMGKRLAEAKLIVRHGGFMQWGIDNCPFSHSTANNYMYVYRSDLKFAKLANLAEQGTVDGIRSHLDRKAQARRRRDEKKAKAEEAAERQANPPRTLNEAYTSRRRQR